MLRTVETLILDEVHAVAGTKRGAHLALSVERLERPRRPTDRSGSALSATQRPLEEIGRFVSGGRPIELVDAGTRKELDLQVVVPGRGHARAAEHGRALVPVPADGAEMGPGVEASSRSIWPSIYPALLELVREHRSTIVFVNNRRLAERLALRLNELAGEEHRARAPRLARARTADRDRGAAEARRDPVPRRHVVPRARHRHGRRRSRGPGREPEVGRARPAARSAAPATSSAPSRSGRIFPKYRADLLESAVVAPAMRRRRDRGDAIPRNPLDVLAQQIVAICADDEIAVDELHELVRRAYPFADLSRAQLENVLDMLSGRYPSDEFAELRPRIVWDRTAGTIRGRDGARRLAVTNGGTIPDRGLFGVFLGRGRRPRRRARRGDGLRGARGADVPARRVDLADRGDHARPRARHARAGRARAQSRSGTARASAGPYELGAAIGAPRASWSPCSDEKAARAPAAATTTSTSAPPRNLMTFLREQVAATGVVPDRPHDRRRALPRRDRRLARLHPDAVRRPRARAVGDGARRAAARQRSAWRRSRSGPTTASRCTSPTPTRRRPSTSCSSTPTRSRTSSCGEVGQTALFGARFRENAARALLIPRRRPGQRTPLWQQRLKAQSLLQVARSYGSFPIILETYRECLQDVFDLPALHRLLQGIRTRELDLVEVETQSASPFASSLLFDYIATYMYEDDTPAAERRAQALSLDRDLLRELLGQEELRDLLDPGALEEVEAPAPAAPRNADELHDLLRRAGDLVRRRVRRRLRRDAPPRAARDLRVRLGGARTADRRRGRRPLPRRVRRHAAGRSAGRVPRAGRRCRSGRCSPASPARAARSRPPRSPRASASTRRARRAGAARRWSATTSSSAASSARAARSGSGATPTSCGGCAARRSPRCVARSSRPSRWRSGASCRAGTGSTGARRCARRSSRCRGWRCRCRSGRPTCCRVAFRLLAALSSTRCAPPARSSGSAPGSIASPSTSARTRRCLGAPAGGAESRERAALVRFAALSAASAMFWPDLLAAAELESEEALPALWELVWAGEVTNDAWTPLRAGRRYGCPQAARRHVASRAARAQATATQGRWSLTTRLFTGGRIDARSPSCSSSARASSRATACAARASRAATAPSTAS